MSLLIQKLEEALSSGELSLPQSTLTLAKRYMDNRKANAVKVSKTVKDMTSAAFIKLTPVKLDNQLLFGSHVRSNYAQELSLHPAIYVDGEWKPDVANPILKTFLSERALSDALFNNHKYSGQQCTFTELNGVKTEEYKPNFSTEQELNQFEQLQCSDALEAVERLETLCVQLEDPEFRIKKEFKKSLLDCLKVLERYSNHDLAFSMSLAREKLEKNFHHIRSEVLSNLTGILQDIAEPVTMIEDKTQKPTESVIQDMFHAFNSASPEYKAMNDVMTAFAPNLTAEERKDLSRFIESSSTRHIRESEVGAQTCKGSIKFANIHGSPKFLFGNAMQQNDFFSVRFGFANDSLDSFGDIRIRECQSFAEVYLTQYQLLDLIQGSLNGHYIKCTLNNYLRRYLKNPSEELEHDQFDYKGKPKYDKNEKLESILDQLDSLIGKNSQAKAHKQSIIALVGQLADIVEAEGEKRTKEYGDETQTLLRNFYDHHGKEMTSLVESVVGKRPELAEKIHGMMRLESK